MIEAVENHMPEVIVIDEIGSQAEAHAAATIAQRGVQLVATAHGQTLDNIVNNPTLQGLVGGIQRQVSCTVVTWRDTAHLLGCTWYCYMVLPHGTVTWYCYTVLLHGTVTRYYYMVLLYGTVTWYCYIGITKPQ